MISLELTITPGMPSGAGASGQAVAAYGKLFVSTLSKPVGLLGRPVDFRLGL